jgi:hypothetical protein
MKIVLFLAVLMFAPIVCAEARGISVKWLAETCKTPEDLGRCVNENVWYGNDQERWGKYDYWQTPEETLRVYKKYGVRTGDCEDVAVLAFVVLQKQGYDPRVLSMHFKKNNGSKEAHGVCAFRYGGKMCYIQNSGFYRTDCADYKALADSFYKDRLLKAYIVKNPLDLCDANRFGFYLNPIDFEVIDASFNDVEIKTDVAGGGNLERGDR